MFSNYSFVKIYSLSFFLMTGFHSLLAIENNALFTSVNDEASTATALPMNISPCGSDTRIVRVFDATTSGSGPFGNCKSSFSSKDVWFKVIVPSTGNFLIRRNDKTAIQLYAEAYLGIPTTANDTISCQSLVVLPNVMFISGQTPGEEIYFRFWDKNNVAATEGEISAHLLSSNPDEWLLCDYLNNGLTTIYEESVRFANEFIVQYDADDTADSINLKRNILTNELGLSLVDSCNCSTKNIEVWAANNPVEMEDRRRISKKRGNVDTTAYNYLINIRTHRDSLIETTIPNDNTSNQSQTDVSMDSVGNYVVVWREETTDPNLNDIYTRLFEPDGTPKGVEFRVNDVINENHQAPAVSRRTNGEFIVVWESNQQILAKKYDKDGAELLAETEIAKDDLDGFGNFTVSNPDVTIDKNGNYVIVYQQDYAANTRKVAMQLFNATDVLQRDTLLEDKSISYQLPKTAIAENGQFMVVMASYAGIDPPVAVDDDSYDIVKQSFDPNGDLVSGIIVVNTTTTNAQITPDVAMDKNGNAFVAWTEITSDGKGDIKGQYYKSDGTTDGGEFDVNATPFGEQLLMAVSMNSEGDHIAVWESTMQDGDGSGIYSQYFDRNQTKQGVEFRVNTIATGNQQAAAVVINETGNVIYTWQENRTDLDILHKRYISNPFNAALKNYQESADTTGIQKDAYDRTIYEPNNPVKNVIIATMDTGIDKDHTNFKHALWQYEGSNNCLPNAAGDIGYDFNNDDSDPNDIDGHGTAVNGLIVESFPNDLQLDLLNVKFSEKDTSTLFDAICGIYYAIENGAKVINLSWGFESIERPVILEEAIQEAICNDILIVTSAGNTAKNNDTIGKYPANLSKENANVITVAAYETDVNGQNAALADYSSFGEENVDIAARGFLETTGLNNAFVTLSGTSLSAPIVSRIAGIIRANYPQLTAAQVKECITHPDNVIPYGFPIRSKGALDPVKAMACAADKAAANLPPCASDKISLNANVTEETCSLNDGKIELLLTANTADTTFSWSNGATTQDVTGLSAGNYEVTVADECGCIQTLAIVVTSSCGVGGCEDGDMIIEMPIQGRPYRFEDKLIADDTVFAGVQTTFQAGSSVILQPGFVAQAGADFTAKIGTCTSNNLFPSSPSTAKLNQLPTENLVLKVAPNPTRQNTTLTYFSPTSEPVQLTLSDLNGRVIWQLFDGMLATGWQNYTLNPLQGGVYFVQLRTKQEVVTQKLMVLE